MLSFEKHSIEFLGRNIPNWISDSFNFKLVNSQDEQLKFKLQSALSEIELKAEGKRKNSHPLQWAHFKPSRENVTRHKKRIKISTAFLLIEGKTGLDASIRFTSRNNGFLLLKLSSRSSLSKVGKSNKEIELFIQLNNERLMNERKSNRKWNFWEEEEGGKSSFHVNQLKTFIAFARFPSAPIEMPNFYL